jgi:FkbM family methyltransferase
MRTLTSATFHRLPRGRVKQVIEAFLKNVLWTGMVWWPIRLKAAVVRLLCRDEVFIRTHGRDLIAYVAPLCGIDGLRTTGQFGDILSSPADRTIFAVYASTGTWAQNTNSLFSEFFSENQGGTYLDIGANIGLTTIPIAQLPGVQCVAFEPAPENFRNLQANVRANCDPGKVRTLQLALFEKEGELDFELSNYNLGDHRLTGGETSLVAAEKRRVISVQAGPLDSLDLVRPGCALGVKIDTQGAEPFIIAGGRKTLSRAQLLVLEWCPYMIARMGGDPLVVLQFLRESFRIGSIWRAEAGTEASQYLPMGEICDRLRHTFPAHEKDENYYVDIVAMK